MYQGWMISVGSLDYGQEEQIVSSKSGGKKGANGYMLNSSFF